MILCWISISSDVRPLFIVFLERFSLGETEIWNLFLILLPNVLFPFEILYF